MDYENLDKLCRYEGAVRRTFRTAWGELVRLQALRAGRGAVGATHSGLLPAPRQGELPAAPPANARRKGTRQRASGRRRKGKARSARRVTKA